MIASSNARSGIAARRCAARPPGPSRSIRAHAFCCRVQLVVGISAASTTTSTNTAATNPRVGANRASATVPSTTSTA